MFTGLVEGTGEITALTPTADGLRLSATAPFDLAEVKPGDSIAVSGPCLTVVALTARTFTAEVSAETLQRTNLGGKRPGDRVNLERALRLGDRLGGHIVSGHIDCVAVLAKKTVGPQHMQIVLRLPDQWSRYVVEKGSIAVDGVSLTVNSCTGGEVSINVIPFTARHTTLADLQVGHRLNIETDIIGKYVEKLLQPQDSSGRSGVTHELLARHGFL
ncbi:MAG: riboflavin synthase [Deltaproteobacteria bacterium]|nr:riboflavin synthase [Deltaproteobacteria bacterium]